MNGSGGSVATAPPLPSSPQSLFLIIVSPFTQELRLFLKKSPFLFSNTHISIIPVCHHQCRMPACVVCCNFSNHPGSPFGPFCTHFAHILHPFAPTQAAVGHQKWATTRRLLKARPRVERQPAESNRARKQASGGEPCLCGERERT